MLRYFTSILLFILLFAGQLHAQTEPINLQQKDTTSYKDKYGLRAGIDLGRLAQTFLDENYTGFEIAADYRLTNKWYLAAELGNENNRREELLDEEILYDYTTEGSYIKLGADYNTLNNWYGLNNAFHVGGRYAFSTHTQTLNNFNIFNSSRFFNPEGLAPGSIEPQEFTGLNASWLELVVGIKAELFSNLFLGISTRIAFLVTDTPADNFPNLWIPGFGRVNDTSNFGIGYNYTLTYLIPLYKKKRKKPKEKP